MRRERLHLRLITRVGIEISVMYTNVEWWHGGLTGKKNSQYNVD